MRLPRPTSEHLTEHSWHTTSGYFFDEQFDLARAMFGDDRLVFFTDGPLLIERIDWCARAWVHE